MGFRRDSRWWGVLVLGLLGPSAPTAEPPRVAVVYSSFRDGKYSYRNEYDADLEALAWPFERVENRSVGEWIPNLASVDMVIFTAAYNYENTHDLGQHAEQWRRFLRDGGVLLVTDPNYGSQSTWLAAIDPRLRLVPRSDRCGADGGEPSWMQRDHPLFAEVGRVACAWTHPRAWSPSWRVLARCSDRKPVVLLDEYGRGLVAVTVAYRQYRFPNRRFLRNLVSFARDEERRKRAHEAMRQRREGEAPRLVLRRLDTAPTLDGDVAEAVWGNAARIDGFVRMDASVEVGDQTGVRLGYDDEALWIAFICHDAQAADLAATEKERDGEVYHDDCVEVFLDPTGTRKQFKHFVVNCIGTQYDEDSGDSSWHGVWEAETQTYADHWTAELRIPFASLGLGESGEVAGRWIANFNRHNPKSGELTGWSPTFGGFLVPGRFGELLGLDLPLSRFAFRGAWKEPAGSWRRGDNQVGVEIENRTTQDASGTVVLAHLGREEEPLSAVPVNLGPGQKGTVALSTTLEEPGRAWLAARFATDAGPVWYAPPLEVMIPELLETVLIKPAYRRSLFSTQPDREVVVQAVVSGLQNADGKTWLAGKVEREAGKAGLGVDAASPKGRVEAPGDGTYELAFDVTGQPVGEYHVTVQLLSEGKGVLAGGEHDVRIVPPSDLEVTFDEHRVCRVNGELLFPIGLYQVCQRAIDVIEAENRELGLPNRSPREHLQAIKDHGFNCVVHAWGFPDEGFRELLAEVGLYWSPEIGRTESQQLRRLAEQHRRDPYLLWWYGIDEVAGAGLEKAIRDRAMFEEIDPYHPVAAAVNNPGTFGRCIRAFDILLPDPYPVRNVPLTMVAAWTDGCIRAGEGRVPVWVVPQAFGTRNRWEIPTPRELRAQAYLALTHGATGLIWFTYAHPGFFEGVEGRRSSWYLPETPLWEEFRRLNRELTELAPVLLSPPVEQTVVASSKDIHLLFRQHEGKHYVFTVNASPDPVECRFTGLPPAVGVEVLHGKRVVPAEGGAWRDEFEGYVTRVYRF